MPKKIHFLPVSPLLIDVLIISMCTEKGWNYNFFCSVDSILGFLPAHQCTFQSLDVLGHATGIRNKGETEQPFTSLFFSSLSLLFFSLPPYWLSLWRQRVKIARLTLLFCLCKRGRRPVTTKFCICHLLLSSLLSRAMMIAIRVFR